MLLLLLGPQLLLYAKQQFAAEAQGAVQLPNQPELTMKHSIINASSAVIAG